MTLLFIFMFISYRGEQHVSWSVAVNGVVIGTCEENACWFEHPFWEGSEFKSY